MARWGSALAIAVTLAACSSGGDASPESTLAVSPIPATTDAPTTTSTPTTTPTTTEPPTTTIDPVEALAAEVEADLREADRLENEASQDPFNAGKERSALDRRVGFAADALREKLQSYRDRGLAIRPNGAVPASLTVERPAVLVVDGGDVAQIQVCEVNSWVLVEVGAGPNGSDAVVNPGVVSSRATVFLREVNGVWMLEGGSEIEAWEGAGECPPE